MVFSCLPPPPPEMYLFIFNEKHDPGAILGLGPDKQGKMLGLVRGGAVPVPLPPASRTDPPSLPRWLRDEQDPRLCHPCSSLGS